MKHPWMEPILAQKPALEQFASTILGQPTQLGRRLGCGAAACAFALKSSQAVLRISLSPNEGPTLEAIMKAQAKGRLKGFTKIYGLGRSESLLGPDNGYKLPAVISIAERVKPITSEEWFKLNRELKSRQTRLSYLNELLLQLPETEEIGKSLDYLDRKEIIWRDWQQDNLGWRGRGENRYLVILDPSSGYEPGWNYERVWKQLPKVVNPL